MRETWPYFLANQAEQPNADLEVLDKYTGRVATRVAQADAAAVDRAIAAAVEATEPMRRLRPYERREILQHVVKALKGRRDELATALSVEAGKPMSDARGEVSRLIDTFEVAAEEATRIGGEVMNLEISPRARGYRGMWKRVPLGPCAFITPWNFPLNLVAHKVAPAIAVGCPFVLKPSSRTPVGALIIGEILAETDLPQGAFSVLPCSRADADALITDDRLKLLSFTGSAAAGWAMKARAGKKRVVLELGGNAACIVDADAVATEAALEDVVRRIVIGAFYQSGQSCISVQRILVHEAVYDRVVGALVEATRRLKRGDPKREDTFIGPLITEQDAIRLERWIEEAVAGGARVLCGGRREGVFLEPTLVEDAPRECHLERDEAFGPVATVSRFSDFDAAIEAVNDSVYGLQAGVFTRDIYKVERAWDRLEVGGVVIGDIPSWRVDHMPYGGVKDSGFGREGHRWAIEEMTEVRLLVIRTPPYAQQDGSRPGRQQGR